MDALFKVIKQHEVTNLELLQDRHRLNRKRRLHTGSQEDWTFVRIFFFYPDWKERFCIFFLQFSLFFQQTGITTAAGQLCSNSFFPRWHHPEEQHRAQQSAGAQHNSVQTIFLSISGTSTAAAQPMQQGARSHLHPCIQNACLSARKAIHFHLLLDHD